MTEPKLQSLDVSNFTVFPHAHFKLSPALNVVIGENGAGKTHLLKLMYSVAATSYERARLAPDAEPTKAALQSALAEKLVGVFRPESLGRLTRRQVGRARAEVSIHFTAHAHDLRFSFATNSRSEVSLERAPKAWLRNIPVYMPTRELMTIYPGFVSLYETTYLEFDETWRDTCLLLGRPATRGPREARVRELLEPLESVLGGSVIEEDGRFYLRARGSGSFEMPLVAEGLRKLAMLSRLIATGSLLDSGILFWDEPEANLNPRTLVAVARAIVGLARSGVQVFIATHSLFLMRELEILLTSDPLQDEPRFHGLQLGVNAVSVESGTTLADAGDITALDESLAQSDRYLALDA